MSCPNISSPQWKALVDAVGVREAYKQFAIHGDIPDAGMFPESFHGTNSTLKVVGALNTPKMQQVYDKFFSNNKDKFYAELLNSGATKDQIQLLKAWNEKNNPQSLSDMQAGIVAEMSYTVDVTQATQKKGYDPDEEWGAFDDELSNMSAEQRSIEPTSHYSNLTVPGGTKGSYRELDVRTPEITPSIKSHAAFASNENSIGWYRVDDKDIGVQSVDQIIQSLKDRGELQVIC